MKKLSLDEISLLEEMKSNCLKKGQYINEKAKDKFKMLCHLEDFSIAYYELLDVIKEVREYIEKSKSKLPLGINDFTCEMVYSDEVVLANELLKILDKVEK